MMAMLSDEKDTIQAKQEGDSMAQTASASSSLTIGTSRRWSGFKNPRIVRVSRTFGGKDRHSKVCTIRGLRDRRIRLSVPTAVQLYDLQEKLGLSQPSKVIDWLLDATKVDIDELPPLHFPQFHDQHAPIGHVSNNNYPPPNHFAPYLDANLTLMNAQPPQVGSSSMMTSRKEGININDHFDGENRNEDEDDSHRLVGARLENQYLGGGAFLPSLMNSSTLPPAYGNFYHWNPSNLSLSQFGSHGFSANSEEGYQGGNSSTQQLLFCPPPSTAPLFPHSDTSAAMSAEFQPRGSGLKPLAPHQPQYKPSD